MEKLQFKVRINAPAATVYDKMLGISDKSSYESWTQVFMPTSSYEGNWEKGSKMYFIGMDDKGQKGGMISRIAENIPGKFVSIQHYGILQGGKEITEGPEVEKWSNVHENYTFQEDHEATIVTVDQDITTEYKDYMNETYPKALEKLKEVCEK